MIRRILIDLDDTCNRFKMPCLRALGCLNCDSDADFPVEVGYDIIAAANMKHPTRDDWTPKNFWSSVPEEVWADAPESEIFPWILNVCANIVGRQNVFIMTAPTDEPNCASGKTRWLQYHLPSWMHHQYSITPMKEMAAHPDVLLIDDAMSNIERFRAAGGLGLCVPRPWNPFYRHDTKSFLEGTLKNINNV